MVLSSKSNVAGARFWGSVALCVFLALGGCEELGLPISGAVGNKADKTAPENIPTIERDVEAPEIFQSKDKGLWDGRPSLGGVWVAHPDADKPERVIIRNSTNGKYIIGALFRKERATPGPAVQISSDAALEIDVLAGAPTPLVVTALKKVEIPDPSFVRSAKAKAAGSSDANPLVGAIVGPEVTASSLPITPESPKPAPSNVQSSLSQSFVQVGIFSIEKNAAQTIAQLSAKGINAISKKQTSQGKTFWRVLAGPAQNSAERKEIKNKIVALGFKDAYFVKG